MRNNLNKYFIIALIVNLNYSKKSIKLANTQKFILVLKMEISQLVFLLISISNYRLVNCEVCLNNLKFNKELT